MTRAKKPAKAAASPAVRRDLVALVGRQVRRMGAQNVLTSQIVAARFGLHTTDLEVLDLILMREQASAGELAAATGLTSGSITALIDRLAGAGYVERHADPEDRRRTLVRICHDAVAAIKAAYEPIQTRMFALWSTYDAADLEVIADFLARSTDLAVACADDMRRSAPALPARRRPPRASGREQNQGDSPLVGRAGRRPVPTRRERP